MSETLAATLVTLAATRAEAVASLRLALQVPDRKRAALWRAYIQSLDLKIAPLLRAVAPPAPPPPAPKPRAKHYGGHTPARTAPPPLRVPLKDRIKPTLRKATPK